MKISETNIMIKSFFYTILFLIILTFTILFGYYVYNRWQASKQHPPETKERIAEEEPETEYAYPIKNFTKNQTKKTFGQYITPQNSPVQPERFSGYHTGVDVEVSPEDLDKGVSVYAITNGIIRLVQADVRGYGGIMVIEYLIDNQTVTAIYGHIKYSSVAKEPGDLVTKGEQIAILGDPGAETDNERKHLHFGIHKGAEIELRGYAQNKSELSAWLDPNTLYE